MMRYALEMDDGGVAFMQLVEGADFADAFAKLQSVHPPGRFTGAVREMAEDEIVDRTFRNALKFDGSVDEDKAREIHAANLVTAQEQTARFAERDAAITAAKTALKSATLDDLKAQAAEAALNAQRN